jgi:hypothetical protein
LARRTDREPAGGTEGLFRFVDPKVLARISNLSLLARSVVEGFISGLHRSTYLGRSVDFAESGASTGGSSPAPIGST